MVKLVKDELEKKKQQSKLVNDSKSSKLNVEGADSMDSAYHELYELTQRKFLKQLSKYCGKMQFNIEIPRLFCIDFISTNKINDLKKIMERGKKNTPKSKVRRWSIAERVNLNIVADPESNQKEKIEEYLPCIRVMCEHENEWHTSQLLSILPEPVSPEYSSYLARVMRILKNGSIGSEMLILITESGEKLLSDLEARAIAENSTGESNLQESYTALRKFYLDCYENKNVLCESGNVDMELKRCELKNGKVVWLCEKHIFETNARVLDDGNKKAGKADADLNIEMIQDIEQIDIKI